MQNPKKFKTLKYIPFFAVLRAKSSERKGVKGAGDLGTTPKCLMLLSFLRQSQKGTDGIKNNDRVIPAASGKRTKIWRTNDVLANCNQLRWQKYLLPHSQLGFGEGDIRRSDIDKSHMLRKSPAVTLKKPDLNRIGSVIREWFGDGGGP